MSARSRSREPRWLRIRRAREAERRAMRIADVVRRDRVRRGFILLLLALLLAVVAIAAVCVRSTLAAVRVPIAFTAPPRARTYEVRARRPDNIWLALSAYADSLGTATVTPADSGAAQTLWVLVSEDWRAGGWLLQVRACNGAGCADWSNPVVVSAGGPDTVWALERGPEGLPPRGGLAWKSAARRVGWSLLPGDTAAARIVHQEDVQRRELARICELYGFFVVRGGRATCP